MELSGIATAAALNISGVSTLPTANITTLRNYPNFTGGATVVGVVTASSFTGNLTGNVVGNVTGELAGALLPLVRMVLMYLVLSQQLSFMVMVLI